MSALCEVRQELFNPRQDMLLQCRKNTHAFKRSAYPYSVCTPAAEGCSVKQQAGLFVSIAGQNITECKQD